MATRCSTFASRACPPTGRSSCPASTSPRRRRIPVASLGLLVFAPDADENGDDYATFEFAVQDDGGTANGGVDTDPFANTITIDVTAVNDAPSFTKGADENVLQDSGAHTVAGWATGI